MDNKIFKNIGYHIDYFKNKKYIGSIRVAEPDRKEIGYNGRIHSIAKEDIIFKNRKIKKGEEYYTELFPLCGKKLNKNN